jgi:hypothetical protein
LRLGRGASFRLAGFCRLDHALALGFDHDGLGAAVREVLPDAALFDGRTAKAQCPAGRPLRSGTMLLAISGIVRIVHLLSCVQQR